MHRMETYMSIIDYKRKVYTTNNKYNRFLKKLCQAANFNLKFYLCDREIKLTRAFNIVRVWEL